MIKGTSALATAVSFASGAAVVLLLSSALRARRGDASNDADNTASSKEHSRSSSDEQTQKEEEQVQRQLLHAEAEKHCWKIVEHSFTGAIIYVMDQLGLYETLHQWRPRGASPSDLANVTGYSERWLRELLCQSTAAGFCTYDAASGKFALREQYAPLLRPPEHEVKSMAGMFEFLHGLVSDRPDATIEATKSGIGVDYDFGESPTVIRGIERKNRNFFLHHFLPDIVEKVVDPKSGKRLVDMLEKGIDCADVGCGCGMSTIVMAKRFPRSRFYAYEASTKSLDILRQRMMEEGLTNITLCDVATRTVDKGPRPGQVMDNTFEFVYSHDLLHDMTDPRSLIREVRSRLCRRGGCWVVVDVKCKGSLEANLSMPDVALNYGFSSLLCLSSATSCERSEGLGTMGLHTDLVQKWMNSAGFEHFEELEIEHKPDNSCFIVA